MLVRKFVLAPTALLGALIGALALAAMFVIETAYERPAPIEGEIFSQDPSGTDEAPMVDRRASLPGTGENDDLAGLFAGYASGVDGYSELLAQAGVSSFGMGLQSRGLEGFAMQALSTPDLVDPGTTTQFNAGGTTGGTGGSGTGTSGTLADGTSGTGTSGGTGGLGGTGVSGGTGGSTGGGSTSDPTASTGATNTGGTNTDGTTAASEPATSSEAGTGSSTLADGGSTSGTDGNNTAGNTTDGTNSGTGTSGSDPALADAGTGTQEPSTTDPTVTDPPPPSPVLAAAMMFTSPTPTISAAPTGFNYVSAAIPEPASLALVLLAAVPLTAAVRRRQRRSIAALQRA